jgi:hypothetical protein
MLIWSLCLSDDTVQSRCRHAGCIAEVSESLTICPATRQSDWTTVLPKLIVPSELLPETGVITIFLGPTNGKRSGK